MSESHISHLNFSEYGDFYQLDMSLKVFEIKKKLKDQKIKWIEYNKSKPNYNRYGISLTSLEGDIDGAIDLNSLSEYNKLNNTSYDEMSFKTKTVYWEMFTEISDNFSEIKEHIGRSHILKFKQGGFFPPHRDRGRAFRVVSFFDNAENTYLMIEGKKVNFEIGKVYFLNTRKPHCLFNFADEASMLLLNIEINQQTWAWLNNHLRRK